MIHSEATVAQLELFENVIATAQRLIKAEKDKSKITPIFIAEKVACSAKIFASDALQEVDQSLVVTTLIQRFSHWMGKITTLKDDVGHIEWLTANRKQDWHYWRRYRDYLESKLADTVVEGINEATNEILAQLEDPDRDGPWDRRGLVVGHVQSGKTSNYTGLICKAADAGYKIIIVLAGMHNNLRSQTQMRLEEGFLGYETTANRGPGMPIGVAEFGENLITNSATTRAENGDFSKAIAKHFHGISPEERPWVFVVKKQKTVLTSLLNWIQSRVVDATENERKVVTKLPLLMIDDEADNASVDTGETLFNDDGTPNEEHQPKTINSLIRQILHTFTRKAYVGYTATPFANIFIHHKGTTSKEGPDLFPKSFITNLAAPSNYVGPTKLFGTMTKDGRIDALPLTRDIEDQYDPITNSGWMPPKHNKTHIPIFAGEETIPPSLFEAVCAFVLACSVRELRGQGTEHSSMLVHVTRFVAVQEQVKIQVEQAVKGMRQKIERGINADSLLEQLKELYENDFQPTNCEVSALSKPEDHPPSLPAWEDIRGVLPNILCDIEIRSINGTAKDALDYSTPGASLKVIAIGGDKLARGLTLEGLCVSYFVRTTKMYDTLMQMGRWFGYRPGYLDLCRLYTSPDLVEWFGHIADASEELRSEFDYMASAKLTPEQYGLKVKSHEILTVTSPLKMRSSHTLSLSYSGSLLQTILFHRDASVQADNLAATDNLIKSLGAPFKYGISYKRNENENKWPHSYLWKDIDSSKILLFLNSYLTHPNATRINALMIAKFISEMNQIDHLKHWNVALIAEGGGKGEAHQFTDGISINTFPKRTPEDLKSSSTKPRDLKNFSVGVITSPEDESIDLDDDEWRLALQETQKAWTLDPARNRIELPIIPNGKGIRYSRKVKLGNASRGLLLLYPLSPYAGTPPEVQIIPGWEKPIMAFAIAFPASEDGISVEYEVSALYWDQEYGPTE
jgi:hypothetical protein